jgi:multidrug efflux pump subunit AcrA (membrane-fusion protein)
MNRKNILIGGGAVGGLALIIMLIAAGGGKASAQGAPTSTDLPPVNSGAEVVVDGRLVPVMRAELAFPAGGLVERVAVAEGESVVQDQLILSLRGREQTEAEVAAARLELLSAEQALTDFRRKAFVLAAQAALTEADARKKVEEARAGVWDPSSTRERQRMEDARKWAEDACSRYAYLQARNDGSATSRNLVASAYREYIRAVQEYQAAEGEYESAVKMGGRDGAAVDADIAGAQYALAKAQWKAALAELDRLHAGGPDEEMALAEARVTNAGKRLAAAESALRNTELRAPFAGTVAFLGAREGELIAPGSTAAAVADLSAWEVETIDLSEADVNRIAAGDEAVLAFDAIPGLELPARVTRVGALGREYQGEITFGATLRLDRTDERLRWNMTVMVKIRR